jgi:hypothetical protein
MVVNAFCTVNDKKLYFGKDGALCVSTWKTVDGKKYYLTKNGTPATGWKTISGKKYYFRKSGVMVTGAVKIGKSYYYFNEKGQLQTTTKTVGKTTYYIDDNGCIEARKKGTTYYYADGSKMSSVDALDFETLQTAKGIVAEITTSSMTQSQKIKACFDWVIKKPYVTRRSFVNEPGWPAVYANDHFLLGGGNCFADAAAFAYLAKALGCKNIYVCVDADEPGVGHSWAEVDGKVYDPLFAEAKDYNAYFGVAISKYPLYAILHIAV